MVRKQYPLHIKEKILLLGQRTWIMGVLNVTPDSFSDGGLFLDPEKAAQRGFELASEGADIIDIGGESTRPGSEPISAQEELNRVIPVISALKEKTDALISIDTTKSEVAAYALEAGADIINDVSAFRFDRRMASLAAEKDAPVVLMHMKGTPQTMQISPHYEDVLGEIKSFLREKIDEAQAHGIKKGKIIIDPGIGFGKRFEDNLTLINHLDFFADLDAPLLVGISRKSYIGKILAASPQDRLEGTIGSAIVSIIRGAHILRVHDVKAVKRAVLVAEAILNEKHSTNSSLERQNNYVQ
jgi:dihydropteroate synthase